MAIKVLAKVWEGYPGDSSAELLALLALADWSDDEGRSFPSVASIGRKCRIKSRQAQRIVHRLIDTGLVSVIENANGGAPGASRRYRINLNRLTGVINDRGVKKDTGVIYDADRCHIRRDTGGQNDTLTVIEPSITVKEVSSPAGKRNTKSAEITLQAFIDSCNAAGKLAIPEDDSIFSYAEKVGIDSQMLAVCWEEFKTAYLHDSSKRQKDWRAHFRNAVKRNWYKLWFLKEGAAAQWTTAGEQARRAAA